MLFYSSITRRFKNIVNLSILLFSFLFSSQVFAVDWPDDKPRNWQYYEMLREEKRLQVHLKKQINNLGSAKTIEAVVETKPTATKVGGAMFKRVMSTAGGKMIGVAAVVELIEAIGWVMEDGTYVKKVLKDPNEPDPSFEYCYTYSGTCSPASFADKTAFNTPQAACQGIFDLHSRTYGANTVENRSCDIKPDSATQNTFYKPGGMIISLTATKAKNPLYDPTKEPEHKTFPLTPPLLGAAMLGTGYKDPDPNFNNDNVNTDNWTAVPEAYTPDPSGVGNELADELEGKADRAPKTPDGKSAPIGDPKYKNPLDNNDNANDRQWDGEEGTEGESESTEKENPETGEKVQQGTFKLPKFCDWAMTVCEWYEGWKVTNVKVKQHIDDTKQHQTEEKGFWYSVKDFFGWMKEEPQPDNEDTELEIEDIPVPDKGINISIGEDTCPSYYVEIMGKTRDLSPVYLCQIATGMKAFFIAFGFWSASMIVGRRN